MSPELWDLLKELCHEHAERLWDAHNRAEECLVAELNLVQSGYRRMRRALESIAADVENQNLSKSYRLTMYQDIAREALGVDDA